MKRSTLYNYIFIYGILPFLVFLVGIKSTIYWRDYYVYLDYYSKAKNNDLFFILMNVQDPLFTILNKPFTVFNDGFTIFLVFLAFLTILIKLISFEKATENFYGLFFIYSSYFLTLHDYIQVRVSLAISIMLFSIYFIKKIYFKIFLMLLGVFIHFSVAPIIVFYILEKFIESRIKVLFYSIFVSIVIIFSINFSNFISGTRIETYNNILENGGYDNFNLYAAMPFLQALTLIYIFFIYRNKVIGFEYIFSLFGVFIYYGLYTLPVVSSRLYDITAIFFIIILSRYYKKNSILLFVFLLFILFGLRNLFFVPTSLLYNYANFSDFL